MKILITTLSLCLFAAANLMGQGRVNFANSSFTPIRISSGLNTVILGTASTAGFGFGPASTRISLYASANSADLGAQSTGNHAADFWGFWSIANSLSPVLIGTGANLTHVTNASSTIASAQGTFNGGSILPIPGNNGTPLYFRFMAFSINSFYAGVSSIIQVSPALSPAVSTSMFAAGPDTATTWGGITMVVVTPEPSAIALLGLGSVMILRRRRGGQ